MANKTTTLCWYCKTPKGWRYFPALYELHNQNKRPRAGWVKDSRGEEHHFPQGRFVLRQYSAEGKKVYTPIDSLTPEVAMANLQSASIALLRRGRGEDRKVLKRAAAAYIKDCKDRKAFEAAAQAKLVLDEFVPLCNFTYVKGIHRDLVLKFHAVLRQRGLSERTIANKHDRLKSFLLYCGITPVEVKKMLPPKPKFERGEVTTYTPADCKAILDAADQYMKIAILLCLKLGLRELEAAFAMWSDIDFHHSELIVRGKPELGFAVKDKEQRTLPIPSDLLTMLSEWRQMRPDTVLIVGTESDKPNYHLLRQLKRLAKRAGLNCGQCGGCKSEVQECRTWQLHRFRRTFVTTLLRNGVDASTVMNLAGHADLQTTLRYLKPHNAREMKDRINAITW